MCTDFECHQKKKKKAKVFLIGKARCPSGGSTSGRALKKEVWAGRNLTNIN